MMIFFLYIIIGCFQFTRILTCELKALSNESMLKVSQRQAIKMQRILLWNGLQKAKLPTHLWDEVSLTTCIMWLRLKVITTGLRHDLYVLNNSWMMYLGMLLTVIDNFARLLQLIISDFNCHELFVFILLEIILFEKWILFEKSWK